MPISDHVTVTISIDSIGIATAGFGIPLIVSYGTSGWTELVRFYNGTLAASSDFATTSPEYLAIQAMYSQENQPEMVAVGKAVNKPTQQYTLGCQQAVASTKYTLIVQSSAVSNQAVTYTSSGGSPSIQSIHAGMIAALNAVASAPWTAAYSPLASLAGQNFTVASQANGELTIAAHGLNTGDGPIQVSEVGGALPTGLSALTNYWVIRFDANTIQLATSLVNALAGTFIVLSSNGSGTMTETPQAGALSPVLPFLVTANSSGTWFSIEIRDQNGLPSNTAPLWWSNAQTHADPGVASDLNAILNNNGSWYAVCTQFNSAAYCEGVAAWTEATPSSGYGGKLYLADTCDTQTITGTVGSGGMADALHSSDYTRSSAWYHPSPAQMLVPALYGLVLPLQPGSETWKYKQPVGPTPVQLTGTHRVNLVAKNANTYQGQTSAVAFTWEGTSASGEFIDTVRGLDWWVNDLQTSLLEPLLANPKVPMTDPGITILANEMQGSGERAITNGFIVPGSLVLVVPKAASISSSDRAARNLKGLKIQGELAEAVHFVGAEIIVTA